MNVRASIGRYRGSAALLALAMTLAGGPAAAASFNLVAMPFAKTMPDGSVVPMWGFALDDGVSQPSVPGPALVVPPGDNSLTVQLRNLLPEPTSLVIPGQALPTSAGGTPLPPVRFTDGQGRQRVRAFTAEAAAGGGSQSYSWSGLKPGTYLYHSGSHPQVQVQMGLYGALSHDVVAAAGTTPAQAYAGVAYDSQLTLVFSEIDPRLHAAVAAGRYGQPAPSPLPAGLTLADYPFSTIDYAPRYFLVNGAPHTGPGVPLPAGSVGQSVLLRLLNAGLQSRSPLLQGQHMRLVAEDGQPYAYGREQYAAFLPALKTVDAVFSPSDAARYPLYDRRLATFNPGATGSTDGGMLAFLQVAAGPGGAPTPVNDAYATSEDLLLNVAAAQGVLANDGADATSASLVSGPSHGSLNLASNGSFSYMPQANFNGSDSFSYRALNGSAASAPATVSLTVSAVNDAPVAAGNAYSAMAGTTLTVAAPGVLANDSDVDGDPLTAVSHSALAGLSAQADGGFSYAAPAAAGSYSFSYRASDGSATSAPATVTITVLANQAPVAVNDTASAPVRRASPAYTPVVIAVLANDRDADNNIDPASVSIVTPPNKGGAVIVNANGTVSYVPAFNFRGSENFSYRVRDSGGLSSNTATVKVNVK